MGFSYERLWELTLKRRINKTSLRDMAGYYKFDII